jgi:Bacterial protein of unknown function (DUF899)
MPASEEEFLGSGLLHGGEYVCENAPPFCGRRVGSIEETSTAHVSFTPEQVAAGEAARGLDMLVGTYQWLDLVPKGRDEEGLNFSMAWVRHHDRYDQGYQVNPEAGYQRPAARQRVESQESKVESQESEGQHLDSTLDSRP